MGENDDNDPYVFDENGNIKYPGIINKEELYELNKLYLNNRWERTMKLYKELNINAVFKTYKTKDIIHIVHMKTL